MEGDGSAKKIRVWDPLVRCVHWSLLAAFAFAYLTRSNDYERHLIAGYAVSGLVALRILWGFAGPRQARFSGFVCGPGRIIAYLRDVLRCTARRYTGLNPAGAAMAVTLLMLLVVVTLSGIALDAAENRAGPLGATDLFLHRDLVAFAHVAATNVILVLVPIHVLGVVAASLLHRENLITAMVTGKKRRDQESFDV